MGRMIVKGKEFAAARVLCGDSAPENYAASELRKYLAMLGIPEGDGASVSIREDAAVGRDGYAVSAGENGEITVAGQCQQLKRDGSEGTYWHGGSGNDRSVCPVGRGQRRQSILFESLKATCFLSMFRHELPY